MLGLSESKVRVIAPDVGGGFGSKLDVYAEELLARGARPPARRAGEVGRGAVRGLHVDDPRPRLRDRDASSRRRRTGRSSAARANVTAAMGGYLQLVTPGIPLLGAWIYSGPYAIPNYSVTFTGVFTNTTPTDAYRGAGRPEATFVIERTIDALAAELGMDMIELRRKNFITEFPAHIASGLTIDSGDYHASLDKLLECSVSTTCGPSRRPGASAATSSRSASASRPTPRCAASRPRGSSARSGFGAGGWDRATIRALPPGSVQVITGTSPHGQGHETAWAQIAADQLGYDIVGDRGAARRHGGRPARPRHVREPVAADRRRRARGSRRRR